MWVRLESTAKLIVLGLVCALTDYRSGMSDATRTRPAYWLAGLTVALAVLSLAAVGLLAVRIDRVDEPAFVFLTWNLFLAWIPFVLAVVLHDGARRGRGLAFLGAVGAVWLLFLPNAPYKARRRSSNSGPCLPQ